MASLRHEDHVTSRPETSDPGLESGYAALGRVYQEHIDLVYRYLYKRVGNREDAEDMTSHVFLKAVRHLDGSRGELSIKSWLFQLAKTTLADYWRQYYKNPRAPLQLVMRQPNAEQSAARNEETTETLRQVLNQLPGHYQRVLTLRFLEGLSIKEAAAEMGVTESNVKVLQLRALRRAAEMGEHLL